MGTDRIDITDADFELLPCPFCGSSDVALDNLGDADDHFVSCLECEVQQIANYHKSEAITRWNTRAALADAQRDSERLRDKLMALMPVLTCRHKNTQGGNDYVSCDDCGFEWNYAKATPFYAVSDHNSDIKTLLADAAMKEAKPCQP